MLEQQKIRQELKFSAGEGSTHGIAVTRDGSRVLVTTSQDALWEATPDAAGKLSAGGAKAGFVQLDVTKEDDWLAAVKATVDPYPGTEFEGTLSLVGGSVDAATRTFLAEAVFPNRDGRLRPGLFARVALDLGAD